MRSPSYRKIKAGTEETTSSSVIHSESTSIGLDLMTHISVPIGNMRFAVNQASTSGDSFDTNITVRSVFGKRAATSTTNSLDDASLKLVLSSITTRGLIIGLAYALIWEGVVAGLLPGSQVFSVREYLGGIAVTLAPDALAESAIGAGGFVYAAVAFALILAVGSIRLARYEVRGAE